MIKSIKFAFVSLAVMIGNAFGTEIYATDSLDDKFGATIALSAGIHNSNYGDEFKIYNTNATGVSFELELRNSGIGISSYLSPATINSKKELPVWDDTIKAGQDFNALHYGVSLSFYTKPIREMVIISTSLGYEWFTISSPNKESNTNFKKISTTKTSGAALKIGAMGYHTINRQLTLGLQPYLRYSMHDYRIYNRSLNNGSMQIGILISALWHFTKS